MNEKTVIAHFPSSTKAQTAADQLAGSGFTDNHIRRNTRFGVTYDDKNSDAISDQAETLTGLTVYSKNTSTDENSAVRVLIAADPSVSGMSSSGYGMAGGAAWTLVSFVPEERVEEAVNIIKQNKGIV